MRRLSQKILGGTVVFSVLSVLMPALAYAQTYRYDYTTDDAAAAGIASLFTGGFALIYICACCIGLIVPIACAVIVYKDSQKNNVENGMLWALLSFIFPVIGLLVYFLAIKPDAVRNGTGGNTTTPTTPVSE